ncbi:SprT family zinc-dependent metalloprotease [Aquincola sp. MAHUQ-54]|uniref:SprT family zinc-dependent metalloprotease n=1 Tax=Aquincola agrisoli TaxID=3119538 RepID=A0AAW9QDK5_9BURK
MNPGAPPEGQLALFDPGGAEDAAPRRADAPAAAGLAPAVFRHPSATHELVLGGHVVGYALRRARRRSIGFVVSAEGLTVSAPRWVRQGDVEAALHTKAPWVLRKLQEQRERAHQQLAMRIEWRDGSAFPFLGGTVRVVLDVHTTGAVLQPGAGGADARLHIGLPQPAGPEQIRDAVQSWLQRQARRIFEERCAHFAPRLGVQVRRLLLSSAATRWGSASADRSIRLNWRLVHFSMATIDYVVVHELAHLVEMNHSPAFWRVVSTVLPDYEAARHPLKSTLLPSFD